MAICFLKFARVSVVTPTVTKFTYHSVWVPSSWRWSWRSLWIGTDWWRPLYISHIL